MITGKTFGFVPQRIAAVFLRWPAGVSDCSDYLGVGLKLLCMVFLAVSAVACTTASTYHEDQRSKALAIASQQGVVILTIAELPLSYYCKKIQWPAQKTFSVPPYLILRDVRNLHYFPDNDHYVAEFELSSLIPNDPFTVDWRMTIPKPNDNYYTKSVLLILESRPNNILLTFNYEFVCKALPASDPGNRHDKNPLDN